MYGLTETTGLAIAAPQNTKQCVGVGTPVAMTQVKVVDMNTREKLDAGEHGEICIKGPICCKGYFSADESGGRMQLYDAEGFLQTGDIGYYTKEGYIFFVDRLKEMIKCMDRQVSPAELEELLLKHPDVKEVVVFGVPHPEYGEAARALVVLRDGVLVDGTTEGKLRKFAEDQCASYKHLHGGLEFVSEIEKSVTGKYFRGALRDAFVAKIFTQ